MNLRGLVSVSGKPGLFKLVGQNKSGFVLESLDAQKLKVVINMSTSKLASLEDITIFGDDEDLKLSDIFEKMKSAQVIDAKKSDTNALHQFFEGVAPGYDRDRVYPSDIKKIISWYNIIKDLPLFTEEPSDENTPSLAEEAKKPAQVVEEKAKPVKKAPAKAATRVSQKSK